MVNTLGFLAIAYSTSAWGQQTSIGYLSGTAQWRLTGLDLKSHGVFSVEEMHRR